MVVAIIILAALAATGWGPTVIGMFVSHSKSEFAKDILKETHQEIIEQSAKRMSELEREEATQNYQDSETYKKWHEKTE